MRQINRKHIIKRVVLVMLHFLGFVLLYFVVRKLDFGKLFEYMKYFSAWKVFAGLVILFCVYLIKSYRWMIINRAFGIGADYRTLLVFFLFTGFLGTITPGRMGEFAKIWLLQNRYKSTITVSTSSVLLDRIWDVLTLSLAGGISLLLIISRFTIEWYTLATIFVIFLLALSVVLMPGILFRPALKLAGERPVRQELEQIFRTWRKNRFRFLIPGFSTSLLAFAMLAIIPVFLSADIEAPVDYDTSISAVSISNILAFLPVTIAGFGTREFVFTRIWSMQALSAEIAIAVSTIYFIITYIGSMVLGAGAWMISMRKLYKFREIRKGG